MLILASAVFLYYTVWTLLLVSPTSLTSAQLIITNHTPLTTLLPHSPS